VSSLNDTVASGSAIFIDTAPVIYLVERKTPYFDQLKPLFDRIDTGDVTAVTSPITLAESLYYPYKNEDKKLVDAFTQQLVTGRHVRFVPATAAIADQSAQLRAQYNLGFADAFQVATAVATGCNAFLTNDKQLKRIQALEILVVNDFSMR
jgi:predicted nucleic acid-binding protein